MQIPTFPISDQDLISIGPFLVMVVTGMAVLLVELTPKKGWVVALSLLGVLGAGAETISGWMMGQGTAGFAATVSLDGFSLLFQGVTIVVTVLAILLSERYIQQKGINHGEYYALLIFSASGAMLMASARELILIFVGLEILSIALYVLSGFARTEEKSEEAALKYFLLGAFSSGFFLYGIALYYGGTGTTMLNDFPKVGPGSIISPYTVAGIAFLLVGLCFKAAIVPFHSWTPDVYQGAPTSVTAFMSAGAKAGAFAALIRILNVVIPYSPIWHDIVWVLAAATMIVGNVVALLQTDIKRMLAYSSIAHAGYILVGVLAASAEGNAAVMFYILVYTFMNLGAFGVVIMLTRTGKEYTRIDDLRGLAQRQPAAAILMAIFMFSLAGIPPAAGFVGKFYLFTAAIHAHLVGLTVIGLLASVVGVYYYLTIVARMFMNEPQQDMGPLARAPFARIAVYICAVCTFLLFLFPANVLQAFSDSGHVMNAYGDVSGEFHGGPVDGGRFVTGARGAMGGRGARAQ